jgi:hypothetical protein
LGDADIAKSLSSGVITYGATSYVPQTAHTLQTLPVESPGYPVPIGGGTYATFVAEPWNMQGAARVEAEAPGIAAAEQHEAEVAACRANPSSCSEDPHEIWTPTIVEAEAISGSLEGGLIANEVDALKIGHVLKKYLGINFIEQLETVIEKELFGYSAGEVESWSWGLVNGLNQCDKWAAEGKRKPKDPHCWVYVETVVLFEIPSESLGPFGKTPRIAIGEIPDFAVDPQVAYCVKGVTYCYLT